MIDFHRNIVRTVAALAFGALIAAPIALAQTTPPTRPSSVLPTGGGAALLDPSDTVILLLDHQSGLFQTVKDISITELRNNTIMLAKLATLLKIPGITTASEPNGPNGPLMPEIHQFAPHAVYVPRKGEVNAWDNEDFVRTVRATGRKTLIMVSVWRACVSCARRQDSWLQVYAVIRLGDPSELAHPMRASRSGRDSDDCCQTHRTPPRQAAAKLYALVAPNYAADHYLARRKPRARR